MGGEYKLSKSLVGVSEVTNVGSEAQQHIVGEKEKGMTPPPSSSWALQHTQGWFRNHFQVREAWKVGEGKMEHKNYTGHGWCAVKANYSSCSLGFQSFVMTKKRVPGPANTQGKRPRSQVRPVRVWRMEPERRLVLRGFGAKETFSSDPGTKCLCHSSTGY